MIVVVNATIFYIIVPCKYYIATHNCGGSFTMNWKYMLVSNVKIATISDSHLCHPFGLHKTQITRLLWRN